MHNLDIRTEDGYDLATALRGPDFASSDQLKYMFTARLRALILLSPYASSHRMMLRVCPVSNEQIKVVLKALRTTPRQDAYHFLIHTALGAGALSRLTADESVRESARALAEAAQRVDSISAKRHQGREMFSELDVDKLYALVNCNIDPYGPHGDGVRTLCGCAYTPHPVPRRPWTPRP